MAELKKEYKINGKVVRCTNRETKSDSAGIARTFDIVLDFTGVSEEQILEWASATIVIRQQNKDRQLGDATLKAFEVAGEQVVDVSKMGEVDVTARVKALPADKKRALLEALKAELGDIL